MMPIERTPRNMWKGAIQCIIKTIRHRKDRSINYFRPSPKVIKYYEENFKMLHRKLKKSGKCEDEALYNRIILLNNLEKLYTWASHVQSVIEKEAKVPEKKPVSFSKFKFWEKKPKTSETDIPEPPPDESYEKLFAEIETAPLPENSMLPKTYVRFKFDLNLGTGIFKLVKPSATGEDFLIFTYNSLQSSVSLKVQGLDASLSMNDLSLSSYSNSTFSTIIKKASSDEILWTLGFKLKPDDYLAWSLHSVFQSLEINYNPAFLALVMSFFLVPKTQASAKNAAWDTLKGIQDSTSEALSDLLQGETLYSLSILCSAPKIKIPSPTHQGDFFLKLGDISLKNSPAMDQYEHFSVFMSSLGIVYQEEKTGKFIDVVPDFEILSKVQLLKSKHQVHKRPEVPEIIIQSKLPIFKIILSAAIFHQLQRLPEMFRMEDKKNTEAAPEATIQGKVKKLINGIHAWKEFTATLNGSYVYFFNLGQFGGASNSSCYIKDCSIQDVSRELQMPNCLRLKNIYGECTFSVSSDAEFSKWMRVLSETINEYESRTSLAAKVVEIEEQSVRMMLNFCAPSAVIQLTNEKFELSSEITLRNMQSELESKDYEYAFTGTLGGMEISQNKISKFSRMFQSKESQDMILLKIKHTDSKSPNYKNQDFKVRVQCGVLEVNWNYHLIIELMNFFQFAEYSDPTLILEETVGTVAKDHVLLNFSIKTEEICIYLNNNKTQVALAGISIQNFESKFLVQSEGNLWKGTLGNVEISDLTNYPGTALKGVPEPFKLFSVRENNRLMHFNIMMYADSFTERDLDVSSKVEVELSSVNLVYLHQPVMRIIDYLTYHVLGAFDTANRVKEIDESSVCKPKISEENLKFTSINVKIREPVLYIPPRPGFLQYFVINLGDITVKNSLQKAMNPGWLDIYSIQMKKLHVLSTSTVISEEFDVSLEVTRKLLTSSHLSMPDLDKAFRISGSCSGIKLTLSLRDYTLLISTSDLNILYDDQLDAYISPVYRYPEVLPGEFIAADFKINTVSVLFTAESGPIFELFCIDQAISIVKFNDGTVRFRLKSMDVLGLINEKSVTSKEQELSAMAEKVFSISYDSLLNFFDYSDYFRLSYILFGPVSKVKEEILTIEIRTNLDSSKNISMDLACMRVNFHLSMLYQILSYLTAGIPNYAAAKDTPQDYIRRYRPSEDMITREVASNYYAPRISATINLAKSIIVMPSTSKTTTLVAYLNLTFVYIREKEGMHTGPDITKRLILENFEIFHEKYENLLNIFIREHKRKVLEPLQFIYENKEYKSTSSSIENYVIGSLNCAISYHDLLLLQSSYSFQEEMLLKDSSLLKTLESFSNLQVLENRLLQESEELYIEQKILKRNTQFSFAGLNIILINDALTAYSPILDFSIAIGDKVVSMVEQEGERNLKGTIALRSSYYNPISDVWEPFVEPFNLECEIVSSPSSSIKTQYVFAVSSEVLNINCSEVMVKSFQDILHTWGSNTTDCQEVISPFQIRNELGYSIMIQYKHSTEVSVLEIGSTVDYIIDYYCRDKKLGKSDSITVSIFPGDFQPPKMRVKTNKVQCITYQMENQCVVVDTVLQSTRKTLTVRSPLVIENQTEFVVDLIFQKPGKRETRVCLPQQSCPVPYDLVKSSMGIEISGSSSRKILSLDEYWSKNKTHSGETIVGNIYVCLYYKISKSNSNKRTIYLRPPLIIRNCLPSTIGIRLYDGKPSKFEEISILQNEEFKTHRYSSSSELAASISLENFARSNTFPLLSHNQTVSKVKLADKRNQELFVNLIKLSQGSNLIVFYVTQVIVNNTLNPLAFYQRIKGTEKLIPGQNFSNTILPSNITKKILIGLGNARSRIFKMDSVGIQDIIQLLGDPTPAGTSAKYQYTLDVQLARVLQDEMILTKVIVISPRFLVVNHSGFDVVMAQDGLTECGVLIPEGGQLPFHWADVGHKELVRVRVRGECWAWSGPFSIDSLGSFTVQSKDITQISAFFMLKVEIKILATTAHIILEKELMSTASYRVQNDSSLFSLAIFQKSHAEDTRFIDCCTNCQFTWSSHLSPHEVIVEFIMGQKALEGQDTKSMYILNLDKLNQTLKIKIKEAPVDFDVLYVSVYNEGVTRIVKFSDMPFQHSKEMPDVILSFYNFSIPKLGVSLIEHFKHKNKELLYMTATEVIVLAQSTQKEYKAELIVKDLQADNQMSADAIYPVMLHSAEVSNRKVLHLSMVFCKSSNLHCRNFESFEFLMQTLSVNVDSVCVRKLVDLTGRLWLTSERIEDFFSLLEEFRDPFKNYDSNISKQTYYFSSLKIHPIKFIVSLVPIKEENTKRDIISGIASFGMALTTIECAPVKLYSIQLTDVFASEKRLLDSLKSHYKSQLINEFYSLIGHSNILGNPIGLLNDLGTGVVDFFYEPAQGIINGPISAGEGIIKGTGSLIKNTLSGTFGTVSKLTSSLTTGLTALTQDKEYMMERQRDFAKNKPSNVVDGVGLGMLSFIKNVGQGLTGVITEPIKGFKKDKVGGMMLGGLKGLGGLVVKPIAGALDMVSRSAEGIKNTANIFEETTNYKKDRMPRVFYGTTHMIQIYNYNDAAIMQFLYKIGKKKYYEKEFVEQIQGEDKGGRHISIVFFTDVMVHLSITRQKILWKAYYRNVLAFELEPQALMIKCKGKNNKKEVIIRVEFYHQNNNAMAEKKLMGLLNLT